ncbi:hypothetical protein [Cognatilysobacter xinjiangensis]|nr:hypothetical protein [Lysobacter xinjiangensis]
MPIRSGGIVVCVRRMGARPRSGRRRVSGMCRCVIRGVRIGIMRGGCGNALRLPCRAMRRMRIGRRLRLRRGVHLRIGVVLRRRRPRDGENEQRHGLHSRTSTVRIIPDSMW